jgi:hypothetical protein
MAFSSSVASVAEEMVVPLACSYCLTISANCCWMNPGEKCPVASRPSPLLRARRSASPMSAVDCSAYSRALCCGELCLGLYDPPAPRRGLLFHWAPGPGSASGPRRARSPRAVGEALVGI